VTDVDHKQAAIDAAYAARYGEPTDTYTWDNVADKVLEAAAPHLAAAERERIGRQFMREASRLSGMKLTDAAKVLRAMAAAIAPADCEEAAGAP